MPELRAVPVIDLAPARAGDAAARRATAAAIDEACREIGFFAIRGHGVADAAVEALRDKAHDFFARPLGDKQAARHPVAGTNRGYHQVGGESLAAANDTEAPPDLKEFFHVGPVDVRDESYYTSALGRRHFLPNLWPAAPAGFAEAASTYYRAMSALIVELMRLAALALDVPERFFDDKVDRSIGTMRLNYYPAQAAAPREGQLRAGPSAGGFTTRWRFESHRSFVHRISRSPMLTTNVVGEVATSTHRPARVMTCRPPGTSSPLRIVKPP